MSFHFSEIAAEPVFLAESPRGSERSLGVAVSDPTSNSVSQSAHNLGPYIKRQSASLFCFSSDGQKMSKRKKNYPDPLSIIHKYGADALR